MRLGRVVEGLVNGPQHPGERPYPLNRDGPFGHDIGEGLRRREEPVGFERCREAPPPCHLGTRGGEWSGEE